MIKKINFLALIAIIPFTLALTSCNAKKFYNDTYNGPKNEFTLGNVQKEICEGMSQDQVAISIGSPNIVSKDKDDKETWIYDKIATEARRSGTSGLLLFCQTGADYVNRNEVSQKTLTVVIKFGPDKLVESVNYHSSRF